MKVNRKNSTRRPFQLSTESETSSPVRLYLGKKMGGHGVWGERARDLLFHGASTAKVISAKVQ